jgi:pyruvate/2-oxoglutarate dehydrogenase complex dihydrolipoamide dehydrogenase (E3) component
MQAVKHRKDGMVNGLMQMHKGNFTQNSVDVIWGDGKFVGPKTIEVTDSENRKRTLTADVIVISTGSRAIINDLPGLKEAKPLTHVELMDLEQLPSHLIVLGGGYIGLEFAQAMRRFGSKVTVIDHNSRILKREDEDVSTQLQEILTNEGVVFSTSTSITDVHGTSGESVTLKGTQDGQPIELTGSHILCATGRLPNNENIGLDKLGVKLNAKGHIVVDEWNRATDDGVFAVGDCAGSPHFTHVAYDDFRIVKEYLTGKASSGPRRSVRQLPFTLFTDPELAHCGLREHEAKAEGLKYRLTKIPMATFLKTRTLGETTGFGKAIISADDDTILGFTALGPGVGELLPVVQLAMKKRLPYTDIADLVITHPTLSEGLVALFSAVPPRK